MSFVFSQTVESDLEEIRSFILSAFAAEPKAPFANSDLLHWKYLDPKADGYGSRGYILRQRDKVVAHCGVSPMKLLFPDRAVSGVCFMDWAGDRRLPGVGVLLMRRLMETSEVAIVAGGSEATRAVIPRMGFVRSGHLEYFVRIVRPWKQFLTRPSRLKLNWKRSARLLRNAIWSFSRLKPTPAAWSVRPVPQFDSGDWYNGTANTFTLTRRDPEALNYWLRCPRGLFSGYLILHEGRPCGHFLLNRIGNQTRIVDIRVSTEDPHAWQVAYTLAARQAEEDIDTCEIFAVASIPLAQKALLTNGFHLSLRAPLLLYDPDGVMAKRPPLYWNLIDDDRAIV